ncbi:PilT/PilU family type 4a pilus ATPase [Verminephrobacter aporrectodeae]|uniref:PilT/PilU family type 4a pilus ATPase n=1 Tax=Verminephrobacter aporrectodeae subsp. tuberculatae TaxID=1110392 RepID=A0ABT3KYG2_9BURK|nr:PilT/PilU family type 4a pilus ATPase [Verminephrobacter aporrectodeae]MCW5221613.1 PilT/PilU family type 4a pilus ATPase [Verminephrobacter aporrectodeae subsp. tuberculatae]MCW5257927.1 PilT/PilU family type 4a pilus ATPase [Verminephrobacter aporrectodeae subsp. tuberculatae]MCW5290903.1 PilT/PilU family type 4a pilus ATPase [Verminephrobacter aporrectodeae subsp. tuberculatae]MCW5322939.1 PilT/PilU family type 4a pilus ATPase [Verminephrobacter aporrectodeae subsp. tuberculatae]MCW81651
MGTMNRILRLMSEKKASDLFLSAHAPALLKIHGVCVPINEQILPPEAPRNLLSEVLPPDRIEELEEIGELNMGLLLSGVGRFRISAMRQCGSYAVVIRFIAQEIPAFDTLGLPPVLRELIMGKRGLILVVGATGSGKSTTLASMIDYRNERVTGHILTIEDPVEYHFRNKKSIVNQREVGVDTQSLQTALRNGLRQAPDVILIGEIRDRETMSAAISYAQSGHLCLSTLHGSNSYHALNRILSFYPVEVRPSMLGDLASALRAVVSQRLVRALDGGRVPAVEVLRNTDLVSDLIGKGDFFGVKDAMEKSLTEGSQSFEQALARLVVDAKIDRSEGLAHADSPSNLMWRLQNDFAQGAKAAQTQAPKDTVEKPSFTEIVLDVVRPAA